MGALLVYEQFSSKFPEELRTSQRLATVMHYACLYASEGFDMSYEEFLAAIDSIEILEKLNAIASEEEKRWGVRNITELGSSDEAAGESKKK